MLISRFDLASPYHSGAKKNIHRFFGHKQFFTLTLKERIFRFIACLYGKTGKELPLGIFIYNFFNFGFLIIIV